MATTIRATCSFGCGDIKVSDKDMVVRTAIGENHGQYRFLCPQCKKLVIKKASSRIVEVLTSSGVKHERFHLPLELLEHPDNAPVISLDDVLNLHEELQEENWFDKLVGEQNG